MPEGTPIDLDKMRTIGVITRLSKPVVKEYRTEESGRVKETTDELGNTVTQHAKGDRQDVLLRPETVHMTTTQNGT